MVYTFSAYTAIVWMIKFICNSTVELIQTVPLKQKRGLVHTLSTYFHIVSLPYVLVGKRNTLTVEIHIRNDTGRDISFIAVKVSSMY